MKHNILKKTFIGVIAAVIASVGIMVSKVQAATVGFSMSPMKQSIVLNPGETYKTSFSISNPGTSEEDFSYKISIAPFTYTDETTKQTITVENDGYNMIMDWITIDSPTTGKIKPNETREIYFSIDVPRTAPAGGQYASIVVSSDDETPSEGMTIKETISMGHSIYAEVTGNTVRQGEFSDVSVPGILLDGPIKGSCVIKNTGNTHGTATYTLQVYPLFSGEEVYSNEEKPDTYVIVPDRSYYNETAWDKTPTVGIFNVVYTVEYEGVKEQVSKLVIKCPIWLMFIIFFAIAAIIIWLFVRARGRKKAKREA